MPGVIAATDAGRKRKRTDETKTKANGTHPRKAPKTIANTDNTQADILLLEEQILESRSHYKNITTLQNLLTNDKKPKTATLAGVALCRVFCRLIAGEALVKHGGSSQVDVETAQWLKERLREYVGTLAGWIGSDDVSAESTALTLLMRIVKEETSQGTRRSDQAWRTDRSTFFAVIASLLRTDDATAAREEFVEKYVEEHDDVRFYTMLAIKQFFTTSTNQSEQHTANAIDLLSKIQGIPDSKDDLSDWLGQTPSPSTHQLLSLTAHRKVAQESWLSIFRSPLPPTARKTILNIIAPQILPWFPNRMEVLADFLTDSFTTGGALSLLALTGIFTLMTRHNLDYPSFYPKLYSLLDPALMHSKHRSRFFRLLDLCLASSHLPAALIASFLKRLARLALLAPPGAIVWILPFTYNTLKRHPTCTFLLQRPPHHAHAIYTSSPDYLASGVTDPFSMTEPNPMLTHALDSSLWELHSLETHWHPNVATLAKILGEQFTKRDYALEDFLDHGYGSLIEAELGKEVKRKVEVEWEIPKRVVMREEGEGLNVLGELLSKAMGG